MDKTYQLSLAIRDLRQVEHQLNHISSRLESIQHKKSYTLNNLIRDFTELIDSLEAGEED
ncbi:hypothetical protein [Thermoflavimicrobium daqui]|jgi:hypothetical protein|uniref:Uncharacterized protein n=1 Tax=Thermoflavimicrobium daqui TaxID=2137476 RepID=A0A364K423_9BACL|nr:hypothetical protein [Thermoflavimicrobium daqui]RAL24041.1 hypothetical protein DL897_10085 [Thermoflavimicrobium daqui]